MIRLLTVLWFNSMMNVSIIHLCCLGYSVRCCYSDSDGISFLLIPLSHVTAEYIWSGSNALSFASQAWWIWKNTNIRELLCTVNHKYLEKEEKYVKFGVDMSYSTIAFIKSSPLEHIFFYYFSVKTTLSIFNLKCILCFSFIAIFTYQ